MYGLADGGMMAMQRPRLHVREAVLASLVFFLAATVAAGLIWYSEKHRLEVERARVSILAGHAHELQRNIENALSATYSLAALIRQGRGNIENFEAVASQMLPFYPGVTALQLAPGGVVRHSVPLAGNEKAIGHELLKDPARTKEAFLARDTGKLTLAGPFNLIQGGLGVVGRLPVYLDGERGTSTFWGFTTVLIRFPDVLEGINLDKLIAQGFAYELWRIHPDTGLRQTIATSSPELRLSDPVEAMLQVPNATWTFSLAPIKGWGDPLGLSLKLALGLIFSLLLALLAKLVLQLKAHQQGLERLIVERTSQILATQTQLQATLDAIPDVLLELGLDGRCYDCHVPRTGLWEGFADDPVGKRVADVFPSTAAECILSSLRQANTAGYSRGVEFELQDAADRRWFELSISAKGGEQGQAPRFVALLRETTMRKQAEEAFKASEQRFRDMVNTTDGIVWEADAATLTFSFISKQVERLLGYAVDDWLNPGFWVEHLHAEDRGWVPAYCAEHARRQEPYDFEYRVIAKDGRTVWLRDIVTVVAENGEPRWLRGIKVDITRSKWTEVALQESAARHHAITQSANDAIVTGNSAGNIVGWNRRAEVIFGYAESEVIMQPLTLLMPERYREQHRAGMSRLQTGGEARIIGKAVELTGLRKDGSEFPMELSLAKWEVAEGRFFSGTIRDLTERKMDEASLRIAATAFDSQEGMVVTDAATRILRVNRAFTDITGYAAEEAVGQTPRMLNSGRHGKAFYVAMWEHIQRTGGWRGEIWNRRKNGELYIEWLTITAVKGSCGDVTHYVGTLTDITRRKEAEDAIQHLAFYDPLTQLPNRRLLLDRLQQALATCARSGREGALLFIDLDDFKTLNDTLGHDIGDLLLRQVAERLVICIREGDTVARFGGDEFVVMLEDLSGNPQEAAIQAETVGGKILASLNHAYRLAGTEHQSTPSIGITLFGNRRDTVEELLKRADLAMYQAKAAGRNTLRFFDPDMQAVVSARARLEADLRQGLRQHEFQLHYQAQVDSGGRLTGVEALVRWQHPQHGLVLPAEFIPLAETTGLILPLGHLVLEAACRQLVAWEQRPEMSHLTLAVNVSPRQFRHKDFVEQVMAVLTDTGANSKRLKLELTEGILVVDVDNTIAKMAALRAEGVRFSLDDFGTGYSSLSYLKRLPLDQLKIDKSFVRDVLTGSNDSAIARTVIALGQNLGLSVIAEGVETEAQRDFLALNGCHAYQGYLFSRPLPLDKFEEFAQRG
ncbi:EAL domain-containing protein [Sulfuritalea sp.]|uniref:bifunctional diguanylate cyclase/phosphodiesterase n=1 Tax=Sulfuritalea sp. TaxID=2480090 RepID=UPI00286D8965|nr:EAL domain-containing protein [Sulfuritalea sp.]